MTINYSRRFKKQYQKLPPKVRAKFKQRLLLWREDPTNSLLRLHKLEGKLQNFYSINITGDIRALYEIVGDEVYIYEMIGTHAQLYG